MSKIEEIRAKREEAKRMENEARKMWHAQQNEFDTQKQEARQSVRIVWLWDGVERPEVSQHTMIGVTPTKDIYVTPVLKQKISKDTVKHVLEITVAVSKVSPHNYATQVFYKGVTTQTLKPVDGVIKIDMKEVLYRVKEKLIGKQAGVFNETDTYYPSGREVITAEYLGDIVSFDTKYDRDCKLYTAQYKDRLKGDENYWWMDVTKRFFPDVSDGN